MSFLLHRLYANRFKQLTEICLHFPERGTLLIEGANEAGKSTLFEAVYFALYGEALLDGQKHADLKQYGAEEMRVELEFSVDGRRFVVRRRLVANQKAELDYDDQNGTLQTNKNLTAVNKQILEELHLSSSSLLNSCFVEQKKLDQLENLGLVERQKTINELLNLRILTRLSEEFQIKPADQRERDGQKARVEVARLDARLPELQQAERSDWLCWLYAQAQACMARGQELQKAREEAQQRQEQHMRRRKEIADALAVCDALKHRIQAIGSDLTHRAHSWQEAEGASERCAAEVQRLETLAASLPEAAQRLERGHFLAERLQQLETLEGEAERLRGSLAKIQEDLAAYDALQESWQQGEDEGTRLKTLLGECRTALEQAEARLRQRQAATLRNSHLVTLLQHTTTFSSAAREAEQLAQQCDEARASQKRLPTLTARREALEAAIQRLRQREEDTKELHRIEAALTEAEQKQQEQQTRQAQIETLETQIAEQAQAAQDARAAEQEVGQHLHEVEVRQALAAWAEAAERSADADPNSGRLAELQSEQAQAQTQQQAAEQRLQNAARQTQFGFLILALGLVTGIGGLVLGLTVLLAVAGVGAVVGAVPAKQGWKMQQAARFERENARSAGDRVQGALGAVQVQIAAYGAQQWERAAQEADCRRRLESLQAPLPANPVAARERMTQLSQTSLSEVLEAHRLAQDARQSTENALRLTQQSRDAEKEQADKFDAATLAERIRSLIQEQTRLREAIESASDLPNILRRLDVESDTLDYLTSLLERLRNDVAGCKRLAEQLPRFEQQLGEKTEQQTQAASNTQALAAELVLPGTTPVEWAEAARTEREALRADMTRLPTVTLEERQREAYNAANKTQTALTQLETEQKLRLKELEAKPRAAFEAEEKTLMQSLEENEEAQKPLQSVRADLQAADLPRHYIALQQRLSAMQEKWNQQQADAAKLPNACREFQTAETLLTKRTGEFGAAWQDTLPEEPCPPTPAEALSRLPQIQESLQRRLTAKNEAGLREEDGTLTGTLTDLGNEIARLRLQQEQTESQRRHLLEQMNVAPDTDLNALPQRLSELAVAGTRATAEWESAWQEAKQAVQDNRTERRTRAEPIGVSEEPLDLDGERQCLGDIERRMEVKRSAGEIVLKTRQAIVSNVMPRTTQNVNRLLPLLTDNRYQDVQWDADKNLLTVYDNQARTYVRKNVFSGGAKDQISLALRLAFAIATLPGEHNIQPGWLFLDEPLSSFDRQRTLALVELLTRGLIRRQFPQIFLVSHSEAFDPGLFNYRIRMEAGRAIECTLPQTAQPR